MGVAMRVSQNPAIPDRKKLDLDGDNAIELSIRWSHGSHPRVPVQDDDRDFMIMCLRISGKLYVSLLLDGDALHAMLFDKSFFKGRVDESFAKSKYDMKSLDDYRQWLGSAIVAEARSKIDGDTLVGWEKVAMAPS